MQINTTTQVKLTKFFENHKLPNFIQEEMDNMNSAVQVKKSNLLLKDLGKNKSLELDCFAGEFYQTFKRK